MSKSKRRKSIDPNIGKYVPDKRDTFRLSLLGHLQLKLACLEADDTTSRPVSSVEVKLDSLKPVVVVKYPSYTYFKNSNDVNSPTVNVPSATVCYVGEFVGNFIVWSPNA